MTSLQKVDGVIHVRARQMRALSLPQQPIDLTGHGYRMRVTPKEAQPNNDHHIFSPVARFSVRQKFVLGIGQVLL